MSTYLLINIAIIIFPLLASFEPRFIHHIRNMKPILASILLVGIPFVAYDMLATAAGFWSFNPAHVGSLHLLNIPMEEVLFFITAPFSCLFVYECIIHFFRDRSLNIPPVFFSALPALLITGSILTLPLLYTSSILAISAFTILLVRLARPAILQSSAFYIFLPITFFLFLAFNYILTSIPIVIYGPEFNSGIRILTIPIEDSFFNFSMLTLNLLVYLWAKEILLRRFIN